MVPPPGYQRRTWEVCRHIFASKNVFDIEPDIITFAKGLTSGYVPLGAMIVSDRLYSTLTNKAGRGQIFANGYTYSAHPVSCAVGIANLDILERENICAQVQKTGPYFYDSLYTLMNIDMVGDVRGSHFMVCIECTSDKKNKAIPPAEWHVAKRIFEKCQNKGLLIRPMGHLIVMSPPLIINRLQIDTAVDILRHVIIEVMNELKREGLWN